MSERLCGIILIAIGVMATNLSGDGTALLFLAPISLSVILPSKAERKAIIKILHNIRFALKTYQFRPAIF